MIGADGNPVDEEKVSNALMKGATLAAEKAPRTQDQAKLKLTTRKFIKADLQVRTIRGTIPWSNAFRDSSLC